MYHNLAGRDLISLDDYSEDEILTILRVAEEVMVPLVKSGSDLCRGKILSELFFEPSTRTQFSFSSAIQRLGGGVVGFSETSGTSIAKGETLQDTARILESYSDIMVMRHSEEGSMKFVSDYIKIPLINGGEGKAEHPTQTLYDLFTIQQECRKLSVNICFYGDLKYGRTNHSLMTAASRFGANCVCVAPDELQMPEHFVNKAKTNGSKVEFADSIDDVISNVDVVYMSRLQKERLPQGLNYQNLKSSYEMTASRMKLMKPDALLMHPLPRIGEIPDEIDKDARAAYFRQAKNGIPVRMAVLAMLLGKL